MSRADEPVFPGAPTNATGQCGDYHFGLSKLEYFAAMAVPGLLVAYGQQANRSEISAMARDQAVDLLVCLAELEKEKSQ